MEASVFYESLIAVIKFVEKGNNAIAEEEGKSLAGMYWPRICDLLINKKVGSVMLGGVLVITRHQNVYPILADCYHALGMIARADADRELDNEMKRSNIKYAKQAYKISITSIIIAIIALAWQIISQI